MRPGNPRRRVRWVIVWFLFAFVFISFVQRTSISIAAERMMPELGYSQIEIGWLLTAFLVSYTAFQLPGGVFGEWQARRCPRIRYRARLIAGGAREH